MPTERNPSNALTDAQVDDIVDRLLRGKYEKHRPVGSIEVIRAGLMGQQACRDYVTARWGQRSRWSRGPSTKDGPLSSAGITMRSGKLWERCADHINKMKDVENDEIVWRIYDRSSYEAVCYAVGSRRSAINWAWTLFGWTLPEGSTIERLRSDIHGGGGTIAASTLNMGLVGQMTQRVNELRTRAEKALSEAERIEAAIASVTGAAAHLAAGATVG